jgi:hypothetical protein
MAAEKAANPLTDSAARKIAYVTNSLEEWRARLQLKHRQLMARYARMERAGHPDLLGQGHLIDVNAQLIHVVSNALTNIKQRAS